ncbi:MAG: PAS domain S-box protein [Syntrophomonadaceae bacterium]|jgi:anti-anti-sigma factor
MYSGIDQKEIPDALYKLKAYQTIFDISGCSIVIAQEDATIKQVNDNFVTLLGYSKEEIESKQKWTELCLLEERNNIYDYYQRSRSNPDKTSHYCCDVRFQHKNGTVIHTYVSTAPIPETRESILVIIDITNRKKAEEALQKSNKELELMVRSRTAELEQVNRELQREINERKRTEQKLIKEQQQFNDVLEHLPAYLILITQDYHVPFANRFFRERFGESQGRRCFEFLFGLSEPCTNCESFQCLEKMKRHDWEWIGPDGRTYQIYDIPFIDSDGSTLIMEMGIDITKRKETEAELQKAYDILEARVNERTAELNVELAQRKQAEEAFRKSNAYLKNLLNYANAPIIVWDPEYRIVQFNRAFERLTGLSADQVLGSSLEILFPDSQKEESMALIRRTASGERWEVVEILIAHIDGSVRTVLWNSATIFAEDGSTVIATIAQGQDITERKKAEEALRKSHEELEFRVRERTAELERLNEILRAEIEERKRAEEIISRQAQEILEVSTPAIQIWEGIVAVPVIGTLDSIRTEQLMEQLLQKIVETGSAVALIDVTGVPTIDSQTARYLIETIKAVNLLGAEVVLTGIRPEIARTLVQLGIDLSNVNTRSSFATGLFFALTLLKLQVVKQP